MTLGRLPAADGRRTAPAASRNTAPLIDALRLRLPKTGQVLEIASGTGQHVAAFAAAFPHLAWQPSDIDPENHDSISAWIDHAGLGNVAAPLTLDVSAPWPVASGRAQAVLTINLLHLIPLAYVDAFFEGAAKALSSEGCLIIYGPFLRGSSYASDGDRAFDASLRAHNPDIGYKSVDAVTDMAKEAGFIFVAVDQMPVNNLLLTFAAP